MVKRCHGLAQLLTTSNACGGLPPCVATCQTPVLPPMFGQSGSLINPGNFKSAVGCIHFIESACDKGEAHASQLSNALEHKCHECNVAFGSPKALASHNRIKHGMRAEQRFFCSSDGICQQCDTNFKTRLRLFAHLCDTRRDKCWLAVKHHPEQFIKLSIDEYARLDLEDRSARTSAYAEGKTHPSPVGSASARLGKAIGFARK